MKKSELKTGMLVQTRKGEFGLVLLNTSMGDIIGGDGQEDKTWSRLNAYDDNLNYTADNDFDIVKVYSLNHTKYGASFSLKDRHVLFDRQHIKVKLNDYIDAEIDTTNKVVKLSALMGESIPFTAIKKLYNTIK